MIGSPETGFDNKYLLRRDSAFAGSHAPLPAVVYIALGEAELTGPNGPVTQEFTARLKARDYTGLQLFSETLPGETHVSAPPGAITRGLKAVYGGGRLIIPPP